MVALGNRRLDNCKLSTELFIYLAIYLADVEVIADSCETMLKNSKIFEDIAQSNPNLAQKLKNKLKNFIARLKQLLSKIDALTPEGKLLEECVTDLEDIQKLWDKAVTDGIKTINAINAEQKNNTADNSDVRNQEREQAKQKFSEEYVDLLNSFGIEHNRLADFIYVQRRVFETLQENNFFTNSDNRSRTEINAESGMVVEINMMKLLICAIIQLAVNL